MAEDDSHTSARRAAFDAEVKRSTRATAVAAGLLAIVAFPAWAIFDRLVDPSHSAEFTVIRLALELPLIVLWAASSPVRAGVTPKSSCCSSSG